LSRLRVVTDVDVEALDPAVGRRPHDGELEVQSRLLQRGRGRPDLRVLRTFRTELLLRLLEVRLRRGDALLGLRESGLRTIAVRLGECTGVVGENPLRPVVVPLRPIELGAGTATKTQVLLRAILDRQGSCEYLPIDVSADSMTASALSRMALATSLTSARVGIGESTIDCSI